MGDGVSQRGFWDVTLGFRDPEHGNNYCTVGCHISFSTAPTAEDAIRTLREWRKIGVPLVTVSVEMRDPL